MLETIGKPRQSGLWKSWLIAQTEHISTWPAQHWQSLVRPCHQGSYGSMGSPWPLISFKDTLVFLNCIWELFLAQK